MVRHELVQPARLRRTRLGWAAADRCAALHRLRSCTRLDFASRHGRSSGISFGNAASRWPARQALEGSFFAWRIRAIKAQRERPAMKAIRFDKIGGPEVL